MLAVQVSYLDYQERKRHNIATEQQARHELEENRRHNIVSEWETERSHKAGENISLLTLQETSRHNVAVENEAYRHNYATESETNRHNIMTESLDSQRIEVQRMQAAASQKQAEASMMQAHASQTQAATAALRGAYENELTAAKTNTERQRSQTEAWNTSLAYNQSRREGVKAEYQQLDSFVNLFSSFIPFASIGKGK